MLTKQDLQEILVINFANFEKIFEKKLDIRIGALDQKIEKLSGQIVGVEEKLSERIDGVEGKLSKRIDGTNDKLDRLSNGFEEFRKENSEDHALFQKLIDQGFKNISNLILEVDMQKSRISGLEVVVEKIKKFLFKQREAKF